MGAFVTEKELNENGADLVAEKPTDLVKNLRGTWK